MVFSCLTPFSFRLKNLSDAQSKRDSQGHFNVGFQGNC